MSLHVEVNVKGKIPLISHFITPKGGWDAYGMRCLNYMRNRTAQGFDINNRPFKPYSTVGPIYICMALRPRPSGGTLSRTGKSMRFRSYAHFKKFRKPNLRLTGRMLASLRVIVLKHRVTIFLARGPADKYARHVNEVRPFMGLTKVEAMAQWSI